MVHGILQTRILGVLPVPSPEDLPNPGTESGSPALQADSSPFESSGKMYICWEWDELGDRGIWAFIFFFDLNLFIWMHQVLVAVCGIWFPDQGLNLGPLQS